MLSTIYKEWSDGSSLTTIGKKFSDHNDERTLIFGLFKIQDYGFEVYDWFLFALRHGKEHILKHKNSHLEIAENKIIILIKKLKKLFVSFLPNQIGGEEFFSKVVIVQGVILFLAGDPILTFPTQNTQKFK